MTTRKARTMTTPQTSSRELPRAEPMVQIAKRLVRPTVEPGVKYIGVSVAASREPEPTIVYVDDATLQRLAARKRPARMRMLVEHEDPAFASYMSREIRTIQEALARLTRLTAAQVAPPAVAALQDTVRAALDQYLATLETSAPKSSR
jgi:hypothetical protein